MLPTFSSLQKYLFIPFFRFYGIEKETFLVQNRAQISRLWGNFLKFAKQRVPFPKQFSGRELFEKIEIGTNYLFSKVFGTI